MQKLNMKLRRALSSNTISSNRLMERVAIVSGSTDGIGFAIARDLGKNGAKVVVSSRKKDNVLRATDALRNEGIVAKGIVCHVSKPEDRDNLIDFTLKEFGSIDILVSNAAANPIMGLPILKTQPDAWDKIFDVNVKSAFFLAKSCIEHMNKERGSIIFISSVAGFHPVHGIGAYSASKAALYGVTKALSIECAKLNIRVNCIAPGIINTNFATSLLSDKKFMDYAMTNIPQKRIGEPEDIAGLATFLASTESLYITGETIPVTGGILGRL